jgi:hypothetical protein
MKFIFITLVMTASSALAGSGSSPFRNLNALKNSLGFNRYYSQSPSQPRLLKIAVLDKGFTGYEKEIGKTLPKNTKFIAGPVENPADLKVEHGLKMAQILTGLLTDDLSRAALQPELRLYNVFGYSNFKAAIDDMIAQKVDLVLYSEVWEYGGNHDGKGFINAEVNRALKAGILWVNASGNFALTTYNSNIKTLNDDWVSLPDQNNALALRCNAERSKKCAVKIVLSWNDFKDDVDAGTDKDLDLALTDDLLNILQTSGLKQSADRNEGRPGFSKYPREIIQTEIAPGNYYLRVKDRSKNWNQKDRLRITVDGDAVVMPSHSQEETVLNPADNPGVITVGASDADRSSNSRRMNKPDIFAPSSIQLQDGTEYRGSSNSAAIVAAGVAMLKTFDRDLKREEIIGKIAGNSGQNWGQPGLSLNMLAFSPTGHGCFVDAIYNPMPPYLQHALSMGGVMVQTSAGLRIMTPFDPAQLNFNIRRNRIDDMIVALPQGYFVYPRYAMIPAGAVEIFQRPLEAGLCRAPFSSNGRNFFLP